MRRWRWTETEHEEWGWERVGYCNVLAETGLSKSQVKESDRKLVTMSSQGWRRELKAREVFGTDTWQ